MISSHQVFKRRKVIHCGVPTRNFSPPFNRCSLLRLPHDIQRLIIRDFINCESWFCRIFLISHRFQDMIKQVWNSQSFLNLSHRTFPTLLYETAQKQHLFFQFLINKIGTTNIGSKIKHLKIERVLINGFEFESLLLLLPNLRHLTLIETPTIFEIPNDTRFDKYQRSFLFENDNYIPKFTLKSFCLKNMYLNFTGQSFLRFVTNIVRVLDSNSFLLYSILIYYLNIYPCTKHLILE